jgi:hypothetical protein
MNGAERLMMLDNKLESFRLISRCYLPDGHPRSRLFFSYLSHFRHRALKAFLRKSRGRANQFAINQAMAIRRLKRALELKVRRLLHGFSADARIIVS